MPVSVPRPGGIEWPSLPLHIWTLLSAVAHLARAVEHRASRGVVLLHVSPGYEVLVSMAVSLLHSCRDLSQEELMELLATKVSLALQRGTLWGLPNLDPFPQSFHVNVCHLVVGLCPRVSYCGFSIVKADVEAGVPATCHLSWASHLGCAHVMP